MKNLKKTFCAILTAGALTCALSMPVASQDKDDMKPMKGEKHPQIREAMHHLEQAKQNLEHAAHDFGGHRAKALEHVNQALAECNEALNFDKK